MKIPELAWPHNQEDQPYDEDLLLGIEAGRVSLLIRGRNAWHSTWVKHYLHNATLYTDVASAKAAAEKQRQRGNVFYIVEAPAIQLRGAASNIVLCDSHPDNPFGAFNGFARPMQHSKYGDWIDGIFPGVSVRDAVEAFVHDSGLWAGPLPSEASLRSGRLPADIEIDRSHRKLESLVSSAMGINYSLGWLNYKAGGRYVHTGARAVAARWGESLAEGGLVDLDKEELQDRLRQHRDNALKCMPKSIWERVRAEFIEKQEAERIALRDEWRAKSSAAWDLQMELWEAEEELEAAKTDREHPAESAAGVRAQRERLETAKTRVTELQRELETTQEAAEELHETYLKMPR